MTQATPLLSAEQTAAALPYPELADEIAALLAAPGVEVPARMVMPLAGAGTLFVMPSTDGTLAVTKLITFTPANVGSTRPTIQGDVVVFEVASGARRLTIDGPTVTARRTAAVSLLAARRLAPNPEGPLLIVGAGVQGRAHLDAFVDGLGVERVCIASRSPASARALIDYARNRGLDALPAFDLRRALDECPLVVTATPANGVVLNATPRTDAFIAAVGAFTPQMVELSPALCRAIAAAGTVVVDTRDADHEAGDLIQAGLDVSAIPALAQVIGEDWPRPTQGPVLFKSCGWAGWDLAAARLALRAAG
jgi:1-piperideine-2-carboxylate/1-pyrroline-2-carboxylate reductase [NAD(P)H]